LYFYVFEMILIFYLSSSLFNFSFDYHIILSLTILIFEINKNVKYPFYLLLQLHI